MNSNVSKSKKIIKIFLIILIIFFSFIIFLLLRRIIINNVYTRIEEEVLNKSKSFFVDNNYVSLETMNLNYDGCNPYSGVYYDGDYKVYLFCDNYVSTDELLSDKIKLKGDNPLIIHTNEEYTEPGYESIYDVETTNNIEKKEGMYFVYYRASDNDINYEVKRIVIILDKEKNNFGLNGSNEINLLKDEEYIEPGYYAYDKEGNDIKSDVLITGNVDVTKKGSYEIIYTLNKNNKTLKRIINVFDLKIITDLVKTPVLNENTISLDIEGNDYSYTVMPDGNKSNNRKIIYKVTSNGKYEFKIYNGNKYILKTFDINNIYSDIKASCIIEQKDNNIVAKVSASGGYGKLSYSYLDNNIYSNYTNESIYYFKNKVNKTTVKIKDENNKELMINCSNPSIKLNPLEIHFIASGHYDDAILIRSNDTTIFIDGGRSNCAQNDINYLKNLGIEKIDVMIGSHVEEDHIAAQADIINNFDVSRILYSVDIYKCQWNCQCENSDVSRVLNALNNKGKHAEKIDIPTILKFNDITLYFIGPLNIGCNKNDNSFIFILTYGNNTFMFTGDSYSSFNNADALEKNALNLGLNNIKVDVLKYPHHGNNPLPSKTMNKFLPRIIVVPNYKASQYPSSSNQNIIRNYNASMYRQSDSTTGNIVLISDGNNITVEMNKLAIDYKR